VGELFIFLVKLLLNTFPELTLDVLDFLSFNFGLPKYLLRSKRHEGA
jgi:hypothetical protein